jgi:hypothetical protein
LNNPLGVKEELEEVSEEVEALISPLVESLEGVMYEEEEKRGAGAGGEEGETKGACVGVEIREEVEEYRGAEVMISLGVERSEEEEEEE